MEKFLKKYIELQICHGIDPFGEVIFRVKVFGRTLITWTYDGEVIK